MYKIYANTGIIYAIVTKEWSIVAPLALCNNYQPHKKNHIGQCKGFPIAYNQILNEIFPKC